MAVMHGVLLSVLAIPIADAARVRMDSELEAQLDVDNDPKTVEDVAETSKKRWNYVCGGYVKGKHEGRVSFPVTAGPKSVEMCQSFCSAHTLCNFITFEVGSKKCWMERMPNKPDLSSCDNKSTALSYWSDESVEIVSPPQIKWQRICKGWLDWKKGKARGTQIGREGLKKIGGIKDMKRCRRKCDQHVWCNFAIFDAHNKKCMLEATPLKPSKGDCARASGIEAWWRGETDEPEKEEPANPDGADDEAPPCNETSWPDLDHGLSCGPCKVLVNNFGSKYGGSCNNYCQSMSRTCLGAWEEAGDSCEVLSEIGCNNTLESTSDAICECSKASTTVTTTVVRVKLKWAKKHGGSCGRSRRKFKLTTGNETKDLGCFYKCESNLKVPMVASAQKGLALDDTTLHWCPNRAHFVWPNTREMVTSFRMFKAWSPGWNEAYLDKRRAWKSLAKHLKASGGKVLVGTQISCSEKGDDEDWENVKEMMQIFGPDRIMGLAIGNELELLWTKESTYGDKLPECLDRIWNQSYFLNKFHSRVKEMDELGEGFSEIKVTSVFGAFILAEPGWPFYNRKTERIAHVGDFINNVTKAKEHNISSRYVHTVNIYPYFEDHFITHDDPSAETPTCSKALAKSVCFDSPDPEQCMFTWMIGRLRRRLHALGDANSTLWIGETGWSSPQAHTLDTKMAYCDQWSTPKSSADYYSNFLKWDMTMAGRYRGPDHIFYFTMRDSTNFGKQEGFGLVGDGDPSSWCNKVDCKLKKKSLNITRVPLLKKYDEKKEEAL